jgi:2-polyprenyl-6-methoxyphenol hydroxylase-like FAD-dependent oxidoreductase
MKRSRLGLLLADEAERRGIPVHHGRRLVRAEALADGRVRAELHDGTTATADLLVGADGVHSTIRRLIDPHAPAARYVGLTNFGGVTPGDRVEVRTEPEAWHFVFGRRAFFGCHPTPSGDVVWFVNAPRAAIDPEERAAKSLQDWQRELRGLFADDTGPAASLIGAGYLELAADNTYDVGRVPVWHRGPMVLVGDALHAPAPSSGQGASMALEDAVHLARSLRDTTSVEAAFTTFEQERRSRVERIVAYGARSSSTKTPGPVATVFRDALLRLVFRMFVTERSLEWMYGHRVGWDERVT